MQQGVELSLLMKKHIWPDLKMLYNLQQAVAAVKRNLVLIFQEKLLFSAGEKLFLNTPFMPTSQKVQYVHFRRRPKGALDEYLPVI